VRAEVGGFAEPRYTAAHPNGWVAYVTDSARGELVVLHVIRGAVLARLAVGALARHVSLSPDGRTLWIALGSKAEHVAVVDVSRATKPHLVAQFAPPFLAHDVGFVPDGRHAWITSGDEHAVAVYDARSRRRVALLRADAPPQHVSFSSSRAFVTSGDDNVLRVHALDGRLLRTTPVPWGSYNVQQAWGRVVTPSLHEGTVCVLDGRGALVHRERIARSSHDAALLAPD
jgi:DNA-binding beta-propeller fold protein YncE